MKDKSTYLPEISILIPVWDEESIIIKFYFELSRVLSNLKKKSEVIFVDDGSEDNTFKILQKIHSNYQGVKVIKLNRHMGQHLALLIGMHYVRGKIIIGLDADLEYFLENIPRFIDKIDEGYDFVFGWRQNYKKERLRLAFLTFVRCFIRPKVHDFTCPFRAMRKNIVEQMCDCASINWISARIQDSRCAEIKINSCSKENRSSRYTFFRRLNLAFRMISEIFFKNTKINKYDFPSVVGEILG